MAEINYAGEFIVSECILCTVGGLELDLTEQERQSLSLRTSSKTLLQETYHLLILIT